jgi:hypothetical protein
VTIPLKSSKDADAATAAAVKIDATISFFILNLPDPVSFMREVYQTRSGLCNHKPTTPPEATFFICPCGEISQNGIINL